jgi:SAM-dependent methyltransferase
LFLVIFLDLTTNESPKSGKIVKWLGLGILIGVLTLTRPIAKFLILPILVMLVTFFRSEKRNLRLVFAFLLGYILIVSPWIYLNYYHYDNIGFSSQQGDAAIWGASLVYMSENKGVASRDMAQELMLGESLKEVSNPFEKSDIKQKIAIDYIFAHPFSYGKFFIGNFLRLLVWIPLNTHVIFNLESPRAFTPISGDIQRFESYALSAVLILQSTFEFIVFTVGSFLALRDKRRRKLSIIALIFIIMYFLATASMFDGTPRYRLPVIPIMEIFGAYGIVRIYAYLKKNAPGEHFDSADTLLSQKETIKQKRGLKKIYDYFYLLLCKESTELPSGLKLELGSGGGYLKDVIPDVITSDILPVPGVDRTICAENLPFSPGELSAIYMTNTFHHIKNINDFLTSANSCLKTGGKIVMVEPANTLFSNIIYRYFHHENFDTKSKGWELLTEGPMTGANGALPWNVLIRDKELFIQRYPHLAIEKIAYICPFSYLASGGMSKSQIIPDSLFPLVLKWENSFPALNRYIGMFMLVVLRKSNES